MIKIDFHIHTVSTASDSCFEFDLEKFIEYVKHAELDAIAITNHNIFDSEQYKQIVSALEIKVYPGIEINLENGHLLLISNGENLEQFSRQCKKVADLIISPKDSITVDKLLNIFTDISKNILIPHYEKKPAISNEVIEKLSQYISAGEVNSPKKFMYCLNNKTSLVPVHFSDCRISSNLNRFPVRQTYLSCDGVTFTNIKNCLQDKNKVSLSANEASHMFQIFDDGQELSTGLNIVLGERSSGKTYMLNRISKEHKNARYIKQFSLVERDEKEDEKKFNKLLSEKHSLLTRDYLEELQVVVNDVIDVDLDEDLESVSQYLESLIKYAKESERHDVYSKAQLFSEDEFSILNQKGLKDLIASTENLIENIEYRKIIEKYVLLKDLKKLIVELMTEYGEKEKNRLKKKWLNSLIKEIKDKLQIKSAATSIQDVDLYRVSMNTHKIKTFEKIVALAKNEYEIERKNIQGFEVIAKTSEFEGAGELKKQSRLKSGFSDAFNNYKKPYIYLQELRNIDNLEEADFYKYFVKIEYKILNEDGFEVSGGERSEFNLLQEIQDAQKYNMLLIDEPESSFDNIFLKNGVNEIIKDLSKNMPVVLVTHNSTVGASIKPDYLLYTNKEVIEGKIEYRLYSGFPSSKELLSRDEKSLKTFEVTLGCLEAGEQAYNERKLGYENLKN